MLKTLFRSSSRPVRGSFDSFRVTDTQKHKLFLSVGAMKASTSWMYQVLSHHPDIRFTYQKELHYFAYKYGVTELLNDQARINSSQTFLSFENETNIDYIKQTAEWVTKYLKPPTNDKWFLDLFEAANEDCYLSDFSNLTCFISEYAWNDIFTNFKDVKVLYTMRNPMERLWSHAKFHIAISSNGNDSINNWQANDIEKLVRQKFIWKNAEYSKIVKRLQKCIPTDKLKLSFCDDIHVNERSWLNQLEDFLELPHHQYSDELVNTKINVSEKYSMPTWFIDTFAKDIQTIQTELYELGLQLPPKWKE